MQNMDNMEMSDAAAAFLSNWMGYDNFHIWRDVKRRAEFSSTTHFVNWLLKVANSTLTSEDCPEIITRASRPTAEIITIPRSSSPLSLINKDRLDSTTKFSDRSASKTSMMQSNIFTSSQPGHIPPHTTPHRHSVSVIEKSSSNHSVSDNVFLPATTCTGNDKDDGETLEKTSLMLLSQQIGGSEDVVEMGEHLSTDASFLRASEENDTGVMQVEDLDVSPERDDDNLIEADKFSADATEDDRLEESSEDDNVETFTGAAVKQEEEIHLIDEDPDNYQVDHQGVYNADTINVAPSPTNENESGLGFAKSPANSSAPCNLCGKMFSKPWNLQVHLKTVHYGIKEFQCDLCKQRFSQKVHIKRHKCAAVLQAPLGLGGIGLP